MTATAPLAQPYTCVYTVMKTCIECGTTWRGNSFVKHPEGAKPLPGICGNCIDKSEARLAEFAARAHAARAGSDGPASLDDVPPPRYTDDR